MIVLLTEHRAEFSGVVTMVVPKLQTKPHRSGFTLLELLMVIAIISVMMSLVFFVMNGMTENAEAEATKTTVNKINRLLEQRIEAFERAFKGSRRDAYVKATVGLLTVIDGRFDHFRTFPEQAPPSIVLLAHKAAFRFEFPQRMVELILAAGDDINFNGLPDSVEQKIARPNARAALFQQTGSEPTDAQIQALVNSRWDVHKANAAAGRDKTESSELLYYTLVISGTFGSSPVDADQFSPLEVVDTDEDGLPEFVDAWGEPFRFYRWPTRLIDPTAPNPFVPDFDNPADPTETRSIEPLEREYAGLLIRGLPPAPVPLPGPSGGLTTQRDMLFVDPDDPVGLLYSFIEDPQYKGMGIDLTREFNEGKYHTPDTYHAPLIVSAGLDGKLGLYEPNQIDFDINQDGAVDPDEETAGVNIGTFDGILGNLAQYSGTTDLNRTPAPAVLDQIVDNITNRNRRAGSKK
jgi:prepilin-type N-terminal cleavage/methylation domain-containing protein